MFDRILAAALLLAACGTISPQQQHRPAATEALRTATFSLPAASGAVSAEAAVFHVRDAAATYEVAIVREPQSGLTWWTSRDVRYSSGVDYLLDLPSHLKPTTAAAVLADDGIVVASLVAFHPIIYIERATLRFESLEDAVSKARQLIATGDPSALHRALTTRSVTLDQQLRQDFMLPAGASGGGPGPTIDRFVHTADGYEITLAGPNGDFVDISLSDGFEVVRLRRRR